MNNTHYELLDKNKKESLHQEAFNDTYNAISDFCSNSQKIYKYIHENGKKDSQEHYIHEVLCSAPGHGKTTALEYHIKLEIHQTQTKKNPYLIVFNNNDTMNTFFESVKNFAHDWQRGNAIVAITEQNLEQFKNVLMNYQLVCISKQRLRDLTLGFGDIDSFLNYQQEKVYWGRKPSKTKKTMVKRTIVIDEMPEFFNKSIFDIGKENNAVDWFDAFANNTSEGNLSAEDKNKGRLLISRLVTNELHCWGNTTQKLIRTISGTSEEQDILRIIESLNKNDAEYTNVLRYQWFMKLLQEDKVGAINGSAKKKNILCAEFIDYRPLGNILILDGTSNLTHTTYEFGGFNIKQVHNYHAYGNRLRFFWNKINTSSSKRTDHKSEIREQIADDILEKRDKGIDILPIPAKGDTSFYIKSGVITPEQYEQFFQERQSENDSMAINLHNVTGKNDLSKYNHIGLLNLPILQPDEYRLQAIAIYGTDTDIRLVKEIEDSNEQKLHKGKWFVSPQVQNLFEEQQQAELSQIIHRSSIRKLNSNESVRNSIKN